MQLTPRSGSRHVPPAGHVDDLRMKLLVRLVGDARPGRLPAGGDDLESRIACCPLDLGARMVALEVPRARTLPAPVVVLGEDLDPRAGEHARAGVRRRLAAPAEE